MQELLVHLQQFEPVLVIILAITSLVRGLDAYVHRGDELERSISGKPSMRTDLDAFMAATRLNLEELAEGIEQMQKKASDYADEQQKAIGRVEERVTAVDIKANKVLGDFRVFRARTDEKMRSVFTLLGQRHEEDHRRTRGGDGEDDI